MSAVRQTCRSLWVGALCIATACSFDHGSIADDAGVPDSPIDAPPRSYVVAATITRGGPGFMLVQPVNEYEALAQCPEQPAERVHKVLLSHPTLPLAFAADSGFAGIALDCGATTYLGSTVIGGSRPQQSIVYDSDAAIGFFTVDGPGPLGVYRFAAAGDGTPSITSSTNATTQAGALALDAERATLVTAGPNVTAGYTLTGNLDLPAEATNATGCAQPIDLVASGGFVLLFCGDMPDVLRYTTTPFAFESQAGALGTVDGVVALPGDRAIAARTTPDLTLINLSGGSPTWTPGPSLGSRVSAMSASLDGRVLATSRPLDATTSELVVWRIEDESITAISTQSVNGVVTALAVTSAL